MLVRVPCPVSHVDKSLEIIVIRYVLRNSVAPRNGSCPHCSALSAAILPKLNRGAFDVGVGTEHAAVAGFRPKNGVTRLALKEDKARFCWHLSFGPRSTVRAGNYRPRDYLHVTSCNAYLTSPLRRKASQPQQSVGESSAKSEAYLSPGRCAVRGGMARDLPARHAPRSPSTRRTVTQEQLRQRLRLRQ